MAPDFFSGTKGRWHYFSLAQGTFRDYLQGETVRLKRYFYVLRPLLAAQWIDAGRGMPPMRFADLANEIVNDEALRDEINQLLKIKMAVGEAEHGTRLPLIHAFIERELAKEKPPVDFKRPVGEDAQLDRLLMETVFGDRVP